MTHPLRRRRLTPLPALSPRSPTAPRRTFLSSDPPRSSCSTPLAPFRAALRHRDLRILLTGQTASDAGDWLYNVALLALVYDRTGSSTWLGVDHRRPVLPLVVLGPLGGVLADRLDRRG